jgi:hypothetical protein
MDISIRRRDAGALVPAGKRSEQTHVGPGGVLFASPLRVGAVAGPWSFTRKLAPAFQKGGNKPTRP